MADGHKIPLSMEHIDAQDPPEVTSLIERILGDLSPADRLDYYDHVDPEMVMHVAGNAELAAEGLVLDLYASARIVAKRALKYMQSGGILEEVIALHAGELTLSEKLIAAHAMRFGEDEMDPLLDGDDAKMAEMPPTIDERAVEILIMIQNDETLYEHLLEFINPSLNALGDVRVIEELFLRAAAAPAKRQIIAGEELDREQIIEMMEQELPNMTFDLPDRAGKNAWVER